MNSPHEEPGGFPKTMAAIGGMVFLVFGLWAMADASSFYNSIALFEPYNAHFIQDLGAFQVGLGLTLILAAFVTSDALVSASSVSERGRLCMLSRICWISMLVVIPAWTSRPSPSSESFSWWPA